MAWFAFVGAAEYAATYLGAASTGVSIYQYVKTREQAKDNATFTARQTGEVLKAQIANRTANPITDTRHEYWDIRITNIIQEMRNSLGRPRANIATLIPTSPFKTFIRSHRERIEQSFTSYNTLLSQQQRELENMINEEYTLTIQGVLSDKTSLLESVKSWHTESTAHTLTFNGDNYVSNTSVHCMNLIQPFYANGEQLIRNNKESLLRRITTEFNALRQQANDECILVIKLLENKAISKVEELDQVQFILAQVGYALPDRRAFLLNMIMCEPGM